MGFGVVGLLGWLGCGCFCFLLGFGLVGAPVYMAYVLRGPPYAFSKKLYITYLKRISQHTAR